MEKESTTAILLQIINSFNQFKHVILNRFLHWVYFCDHEIFAMPNYCHKNNWKKKKKNLDHQAMV